MSETPHATFEMIRLSVQDKVAVITLNRPERFNAAPPQMFDEIRTALPTLAGLGARALLITGEGRAFCSGADLQVSGQAPQGETRGQRSHRALTQHYAPALLALSELAMPVVAAVNGPAAGIGCSLALAADFTLAARSAYFLQAFVNIGLVPDGGATWMLPRLVGKARALQMMMLGERIPASQAEIWGLIFKSAEDGDLMAEAMALSSHLAKGPTRALGLMRRGLVQGLSQTYAEAMDAEADHQALAAETADAAEGIAAFLARRQAVFGGS